MSETAMTRWAPGAFAVGGVLLLWQALSGLAGAGAAVPGPAAAVAAIWREQALLLENAAPTLFIALAGLAVALAAAFLTAGASALSLRTQRALTPLVFAQQTVPLVAIAPLVARLIGEGAFANILITAWLCWFPAAIAFTAGFLRVDPDHLALFRVAGATRWQTFTGLRLPGAADAIVAGVRASAGFALIGAIVVEYGAAAKGLGAMIILHVREIAPLAPDTLIGLVLFCSALGAAVTFGAATLARLAVRRWLPAG